MTSGRLQACSRYEAAWRIREGSAAALYNWGVALSDMAHAVRGGGTGYGDAADLLLVAAEKYGASLKWNPNNPQVGDAVCTQWEQLI